MQIQCGVTFFILDSRRVLAPAPKVLGPDIKTHLKSRFCLQAIVKKGGALLESEIDGLILLVAYWYDSGRPPYMLSYMSYGSVSLVARTRTEISTNCVPAHQWYTNGTPMLCIDPSVWKCHSKNCTMCAWKNTPIGVKLPHKKGLLLERQEYCRIQAVYVQRPSACWRATSRQGLHVPLKNSTTRA